MNSQCKLDLIKENLAEIIGVKELDEKILEGKPFKVYWGTSPTGRPHIGYFIPLLKIAQLVKADCEVIILLADLHAYLDAMKTSWELLDLRTQFYEELIKQMLLRLDVDLSKVKFIRGSSYQLNKEYTIDMYKFMSKITVDTAQKGGAEVVKQSDNPVLSGLAYPILQVLDEVYLNCDAELGGIDQRKIFMMSRDHIHKIGYKPVIHLMNQMIPNITSKISQTTEDSKQNDNQQFIKSENMDKYIEQITKLKTKKLTWDNFVKISGNIASELADKNNKNISLQKMSSSETNSKIDLIEEPKSIKKKISSSFAEPKNISNTLFIFLKYVIFPINKLKNIEKFVVIRDEKFGGSIEFATLIEMEDKYKEDILTPQDLKKGISDWLINFLEPVRNYFESDVMKELIKNAY